MGGKKSTTWNPNNEAFGIKPKSGWTLLKYSGQQTVKPIKESIVWPNLKENPDFPMEVL